MGLEPPPLGDGEPSAAWVSAALGVDLDEAEWLLVLYRFLPAEGEPRPYRVYECEAL